MSASATVNECVSIIVCAEKSVVERVTEVRPNLSDVEVEQGGLRGKGRGLYERMDSDQDTKSDGL